MEVLACAESAEAVIAAVQSGADAIYITLWRPRRARLYRGRADEVRAVLPVCAAAAYTPSWTRW